MRIIRKSFVFLFLALFSFFSFLSVGFADFTIIGEGNATSNDGNTNNGGGQGCSTASACWNGYSNPTSLAGARVTLVDRSGKKVEGTRSVDIRKSGDGQVHTGVSIEFQGKKAALIRWGDKNTYDYKYGTNNNDDYLFASVPVFFQNNSTSSQKYVAGGMTLGYFGDALINKTTLDENGNAMYPYKGTNMDFLSLYLHLNGYLSETDGLVYELEKTNLSKYLALREYSLIFEPLFPSYSVKVNGGTSFYGTSSDYLRLLYLGYSRQGSKYEWEDQIFWGLGGWDQVKVFACALYTPQSEGLDNIGTMTQDCYSMYVDGRTNYIGKDNYLSSAFYMDKNGNGSHFNNYGFGFYSFYLANTIKPPTYPQFSFSEKICNTDSNNDTTFSFSLLTDRDYINFNPSFFDLKKNEVKIFDPSDQGISCVDSVEYDFNDLIYGVKDDAGNLTLGLSGEKEFNNTISIFPVKAKVKRFCSSSTIMNEGIIKDDFTNVFSVKYAGKTIGFNNPTASCSQMRRPNVVEYSCELEYKPVNETLTLKSDSYRTYVDGIENGKGTIEFNNKAFGRNNKLIETFDKYNNSIWSGEENNSNYYTLESSGDSLTCNFEYSIEGCGDDCDPSLGDNNLRFRVIALDNPFPNRDGTSRLPGVNWLNKENYVYEYIVNNRGAVYESYLKGKKQAALDAFLGKTTSDDSTEKYSPEDMYYLVEPMYTVTLTPKTMRKIREYNKKYSYYSMYNIDYTESGAGANETVRQNDKNAKKINCNSNNRECYSTFLRDGEIIPKNDLDGVCVLEKDLSKVREQLNSVTPVPKLSPIGKEVAKRIDDPSYYRDKADLNKNGRLDKWDVVVATYPERHTKFYTCANKTFLSGGPLEGDE